VLCIRAGGDPSIEYGDMKRVATAVLSRGLSFSSLAVDLSQQRDFETYPDTWEMDDLAWYYGAPPSALVVNENTGALTVSPAAIVGAPATLAFAEPLEDGVLEIANEVVTVAAGGATSVNQQCLPFRSGVVLTGTVAIGASASLIVATPCSFCVFFILISIRRSVFNDISFLSVLRSGQRAFSQTVCENDRRDERDSQLRAARQVHAAHDDRLAAARRAAQPHTANQVLRALFRQPVF
jgi:hypothetical protein